MEDVNEDDLELELPDRPLNRSEAAALERLLHDRKAQKRLAEEFREASDRHRADQERQRENQKQDRDIADLFTEVEASFYQTLGQIDESLADIGQTLEERRRQLEDADLEQQANADLLPDGGTIFWSEDGEQAIYADGSAVPAALLGGATRRSGSTTAEQRETWLRAQAEQTRLEREAQAARAESDRLRKEGITPENAQQQSEALKRLQEQLDRLRREAAVKPDLGLTVGAGTHSAIADIKPRVSSANSFATSEMPAPAAPEDLPSLRDGFARAADRGTEPDAPATPPNLVPPVDPRKILGLTS